MRRPIAAALVVAAAVVLAGCSSGPSGHTAAASSVDSSTSSAAATSTSGDPAGVADCHVADQAYGPLAQAMDQAPVVIGVVASHTTIPRLGAGLEGTATKAGAAADEAITNLGMSVAFVGATSPPTAAELAQLQTDLGAVRAACSALGVSVLA